MLGDEVIIDDVEVGPVTDATHWLPLEPQKYIYIRTAGDHAGQIETISLLGTSRTPETPVGATSEGWAQRDPKQWTRYLQLEDRGIHVPTSINVPNAVISKFDPPEPMILVGLQPGKACTQNTSINVYDIGDPTTVAHSGTLTMEYRDLGGYKVTVPAGTFDARLIKITYKGTVGPANVNDSAWVFYAKSVGPIAFVDHKDVSAFLIYNKDERFAAVLQSLPEPVPAGPEATTAK